LPFAFRQRTESLACFSVAISEQRSHAGPQEFGTFLGVRGAFLTILLGTLLGTVIGVGVILVLFASGWKSALAQRASKMGLGGVGGLRWAIASRYQLPLGTFLGIAAFLIMFFGPWTSSRWSLYPLG
jgi:uncharacterized membrane protein YccC